MKQIIAIVAIILTASPCAAQWKFDGNVQIYAFGVHDTSLFWCDDYTSGIYVHRYILSSGSIVPADGGIAGDMITTFASLGPYFFAGVTANQAFRSTDNGGNWTVVAGGPIATNGTYVFSGEGGYGIYRSRDSGVNWDSINLFNVLSFGCDGAYIFAATNNGLWRSLDSGSDTSWHQLSPPISNIQNFAFVGSLTFAANGSGTLIKSTDLGSNWTEITLPRRSITTLVSSGPYLFAGTDSGVFVSLDSGGFWSAENEGMTYLDVNTMCVFDTFLFVSTSSYLNENWYIGQRPISEMTKDTTASVGQTSPPSDSIAIYPNPAQNKITITLSGQVEPEVEMYDALGREVTSASPQPLSPLGEGFSIDVSKVPSGIYFIRLSAGAYAQSRSVVVQK